MTFPLKEGKKKEKNKYIKGEGNDIFYGIENTINYMKMLCWFCDNEEKNGIWSEDEKSRYFYCIDCYIYYSEWIRNNDLGRNVKKKVW